MASSSMKASRTLKSTYRSNFGRRSTSSSSANVFEERRMSLGATARNALFGVDPSKRNELTIVLVSKTQRSSRLIKDRLQDLRGHSSFLSLTTRFPHHFFERLARI